jgi:hypothetical protein
MAGEQITEVLLTLDPPGCPAQHGCMKTAVG